MSETDSFVEEVTDELRRDRLFAFFRRWGPFVIAGLVGMVALSAWFEWRKAEAAAAAQARGDALYAAASAATAEERLAAITALTEDHATGPVAGLMRAAALAETGKTEEALREYAALAAETGFDPVWRDAARLRGIGAATDADAATSLAALDSLVGPDSPFRRPALEQRAVARIRAGDAKGAEEDLRALLADPATPASQAGRVRSLLASLGLALDPVAPAQ